MAKGKDKDGHGHKPGAHHEEEHEEHVNHEAWVIPYADMLTLLMALFLMLWATSNSDQAKFAALAESLHEAFGNGTGESPPAILSGGPGVFDGQESGVTGGDLDLVPKRPDATELTRAALTGDVGSTPAEQALQREMARAEAEARESAALNSVQHLITERAEQAGVIDSIGFRREARGLVVTVVADPVLFESGSADLRPVGRTIVSTVTDALRQVPNDVMVEGHTDNVAINTAQFPSNWELSSQRGTSVLRYMVDGLRFDANRIASAGYGETRAVAPNDSAEGRASNRRVEIVILADAV